MRCPTIAELPPPPPEKTGWPWTDESPPLPAVPNLGGSWPKVTIVTPSFNQGSYIEETIRSVLLQGYPDLEYIIIDGASTDSSICVIRKYERWLAFWTSEQDEGVTNACNKGFACAGGELLGIMCADDLFKKNGMANLVKLWLVRPGCVGVVGGCPEIDLEGNEVNPGIPFIRDSSAMGDWGVRAWFVSVACLFRADLFRLAGGFDERFKSGSDVDMWVKLSKMGPFSLTDEIVATARFNPQSVSHRDRLGELSAWIASNYLNGSIDVAKEILARYGREQVELSPGANSGRSCVRSLLGWLRGRMLRLIAGHR